MGDGRRATGDGRRAMGDGRWAMGDGRRRHPPEADLDSTMKMANEGVYNYMQEPGEFTITGRDNPTEMIKVVGEFLAGVDAKK